MLENQMQEINFSTKDYPIFLDQMTQEEFIQSVLESQADADRGLGDTLLDGNLFNLLAIGFKL